MDLLYFILTIASLIGVLLLIIWSRYRRKLKPIKALYESLTLEQKNRVLELVSSYTETQQTGAFLVPTGTVENTDVVIYVPYDLDFAWKGKSFAVNFSQDESNPEIEIKQVHNSYNYSFLNGIKFTTVLTPRIETKNGKKRNTWSTRNLMARNKELKKYIASITKKYQLDILTSIIANKPILINYYEPLWQIRIGDGIQWIQSHENVKCGICKKKMKFIFNLPGEYSGKKGYGEFMYYIFGCEYHQDEIDYKIQAF